MLQVLRLTTEERKAVRRLVLSIYHDRLEEGAFLDVATVCAHELPRRIREVFLSFKIRETSLGLQVVNNPITPDDIGPTPLAHWRSGEYRPLNMGQLLHGLYATLLGEPFGFATQQQGRLFNDLIPLQQAPGNSSSGGGRIGLHTEDYSFTQPFMPDYLGFMCLRNPRHAVTTFSSLHKQQLSDEDARILFEKGFPYRNSLVRPVLFGDCRSPYLRYGSIYEEQVTGEMLSAMRALSAALAANKRDVILQQGDCLYLDNFVAVHGREQFEIEYGAMGRWFSRLFVVRDLRTTRSLRESTCSRVLLKRDQVD